MVGVIFITTPSLFHLFRSSQHPKKWIVLKMSLGNVSASGVVTCRYPHTYLKSPLEKSSLFVVNVTGFIEKMFC